MNDMSKTIVPKSNQLNYDDFLLGESKIITITKVSVTSGDQPTTINYEGDNGKPYKPCLSMRRVLVFIWGKNGNEYIGRSLKLYGDPNVMFGGVKTGGIRISHMSHISEPITMALTTTRANRKPYTVQPLTDSTPKLEDYLADMENSQNLEGLQFKYQEAWKLFKNDKPTIKEVYDRRKKQLSEIITNSDVVPVNPTQG